MCMYLTAHNVLWIVWQMFAIVQSSIKWKDSKNLLTALSRTLFTSLCTLLPELYHKPNTTSHNKHFCYTIKQPLRITKFLKPSQNFSESTSYHEFHLWESQNILEWAIAICIQYVRKNLRFSCLKGQNKEKSLLLTAGHKWWWYITITFVA